MFGKNERRSRLDQTSAPNELDLEVEYDVGRICVLILGAIVGGFALGVLTTLVP